METPPNTHSDDQTDLDHGVTLMMKALDGRLEPEEQNDWQDVLSHRPDLAAEYQELSQISRVLDAFRDRMLLEHHTRNQEEKGRGFVYLGLSLIPLGLAVIWGFGVGHVLLSPSIPWLLKAGGCLVLVGMIVVFLKVFFNRIQTLPSDRYTEVDR